MKKSPDTPRGVGTNAHSVKAVARADHDATVRKTYEAERTCLTHTVLVNTLFCEVDALENEAQVVVERVRDVCIQLTAIKRMHREECDVSTSRSRADREVERSSGPHA